MSSIPTFSFYLSIDQAIESENTSSETEVNSSGSGGTRVDSDRDGFSLARLLRDHILGRRCECHVGGVSWLLTAAREIRIWVVRYNIPI